MNAPLNKAAQRLRKAVAHAKKCHEAIQRADAALTKAQVAGSKAWQERSDAEKALVKLASGVTEP